MRSFFPVVGNSTAKRKCPPRLFLIPPVWVWMGDDRPITLATLLSDQREKKSPTCSCLRISYEESSFDIIETSYWRECRRKRKIMALTMRCYCGDVILLCQRLGSIRGSCNSYRLCHQNAKTLKAREIRCAEICKRGRKTLFRTHFLHTAVSHWKQCLSSSSHRI